MKNKRIVIAGGTGFIGQALAAWFGRENHITIISRDSVNSHNNGYDHALLLPSQGYDITYRRWDGIHVEKHWANELEDADILINLAGKSVNCRYTAANKKEILESRVHATQALAQAVEQCQRPPRLWINAGSATIYRHAVDRPQDELTGEMHDDFSVQVCKQWEAAFNNAAAPSTRKVLLRIAIVLGNGGVMHPYLALSKWWLAGPQGGGRQMYSWLHVDDLCRLVEWLDDHPETQGTYNAAAPNPVTNGAFMHMLRKATGRSFGLPLYSWMLSVGAAFIGTEKELLLKSRWVLPTRLLAAGFSFRFPVLSDAFANIISNTARKAYSFSGPAHETSSPATAATHAAR